MTISKSGTSSKYITIQSQIKGEASVSGLDITGSYLTIDGFASSDTINVEGGSSYLTISNNQVFGASGAGIFLNGDSATVSNITIQSNELGNGGHDGIDLWGNTSTILITQNYIHDLQPGSDGDHVDIVQAYGTGGTSDNGVTIENNYAVNIEEGILFKDFPSNNLTIENNVLATGGPWDIYIFQTTGAIVEHNTAGNINFDGTTKDITLLNNIANQIAVLNGSATFTGRGYNLTAGYVGLSAANTDISGSPTFVGGSSPSTWTGFELTPSSKGVGAASDGLNIGSTYF